MRIISLEKIAVKAKDFSNKSLTEHALSRILITRIIPILKKEVIHLSKQYDAIQRVIQLHAGEHMTAEQIHQFARELIPDLSLGTVYRNLGKMVEQGKIARLMAANGPDRYDQSSVPHGHLACIHCGGFFDIPSEALLPELEAKLGCPVSSYELTVRALCKHCQAASVPLSGD